MAFFSKDPFQHTDTDDQEIEKGNHSRQRDISRTNRERYHDTDEEHEEMEVLPKDVENFRKDKRLQKIMDFLLNEEKEKYFLKLAQEGARLPHHFNVKDIITPEEETETSIFKRELKIVKDQMDQMMKDKDKPTTKTYICLMLFVLFHLIKL